jgi:DNA-binding MarR family transcriptional regulator
LASVPIAKEYYAVGENGAAAATIPANEVPSLATGIGQWLYQGFCLPGDYMLSTYGPVLGTLVDLPVAPGSMLAGVVAGVVWLGTLILIVKVCRWIHDAYITIAAYAMLGQQASLRVGRKVSRRLKIAASNFGSRRQARVAPTLSDEVELGELEYAVLRCQGGLPPDKRLTVEEIADALDIRRSQARKALQSLVLLRLIDGTTGSGMKRGGRYRLTPHGESFLTACNTMAEGPITLKLEDAPSLSVRDAV